MTPQSFANHKELHMATRLYFAALLLLAANIARADDGTIPIDDIHSGDGQCALMANTRANIYYANWINSGQGAEFPLDAAQQSYMEFNQGLETDDALNRLVGEHLERVYAGEYDSEEASSQGFYEHCLESEFPGIVDG